MDLRPVITRRSIRQYKSTKIPDTTVQTLLRSAMAAPSAGNAQPWHFIIITKEETLAQIPTFHPYSKMLLQAPVAILVCADLKEERYPGFWVQDCSAATMNILLSAHIMDLGAVWLGIHPIKARIDGIRTLLSLPEYISPLSLIAVGYPAETKQPSQRFKPDRIHYNEW